MKASFALLALAALATSAIAGKHSDYGYPSINTYPTPEVTSTEYLTTYTTVTTCPVYTTITTGGSTYVDTTLTTSTVVVTECADGSCGGEVTVTKPDTTIGTTTQVEITYTTTCPVTETVTVGGSTQTNVYTTTRVEVTYVDTTMIETETGPAVTETAAEVVYTTRTSLCPITETRTVEGETVVVTWTSTSTIVTERPVVATEYTSYTVTERVETSVYETVTRPETVRTTVSAAGSTVYVTGTGTLTTTTYAATEEYTITEVVPVTATAEIDVTVVTSQAPVVGETVTSQPTVWVTYGDTTTVISQPGYPTTAATATVVYPTTVSTSVSNPPASSPTTTIPSGLAPRATPVAAAAAAAAAAALLLGAAGLVALL